MYRRLAAAEVLRRRTYRGIVRRYILSYLSYADIYVTIQSLTPMVLSEYMRSPLRLGKNIKFDATFFYEYKQLGH